MTVRDIYDKIDAAFPFSLACEWDNVGMLVGDECSPVTKAVVTLDCTKNAVDYATEIGAELIITHHPIIFDPLKKVTCNSVVYECIKSGISVISAHTNLDVADGGINDELCKLLELKSVQKITADDFTIRKGVLDKTLTAEEFSSKLKNIFSVNVRYTDAKKPIKTVAVCSGAGGGMLEDVLLTDADAFVTGDVKHSQFILAANCGFSVFDCGHFGTENIIVEPLKRTLAEAVPQVSFYSYLKSEILNT